MKYMFDTNIFNDILNENININTFKDNITCFATNVQYDEINKTNNTTRREKLNTVFSSLDTTKLATETFCYDISRLDIDKLGDGMLYTEIKEFMDNINKKKKNNERDALIAETSIQNKLTLVTHDKELYKAVTEFKGSAVNLYYILSDSSRDI